MHGNGASPMGDRTANDLCAGRTKAMSMVQNLYFKQKADLYFAIHVNQSNLPHP